MNKPSVKTLEQAFPGKGKTLRNLLVNADAVRQHPAAIALDRQCYNPPGLSYMRLTALNAELETFGIEYAKGKGTRRTPSFEYLNTGETYATTIIRFANGRYIVSSWGDIVERGNYD